ncbi:MAG: hypothetical protein ABIW46_07745, partial [Acidimicrobiales bacterium]
MLFKKQGSRTAAEADALARAVHHGVVELVEVVDGELRTRWVEGRMLAAIGALPPEEIAGLTSTIATILADLHDRGVVHGGIDATHVLVTAEGRPILCSLGRGGQPTDDVAALGAVMADLVATASDDNPGSASGPGRRRSLGPMLAPPVGTVLAELAAGARNRDVESRPTARGLAAAIAERVPTARLPRPPVAPLLSVPASGRQFTLKAGAIRRPEFPRPAAKRRRSRSGRAMSIRPGPVMVAVAVAAA